MTAVVQIPSADEFLYTAAQARDELGIPAGTVRAWASRKVIYSRGVDRLGRPMYSGAELIRLHARHAEDGPT